MSIDVTRKWPAVLDGVKFELTGSSLVGIPANDVDLFFVWSQELHDKIIADGWTQSKHANAEPDYDNSSLRAAYRKDDYNLIALKSQDDYTRWLIASQLLSALDLRQKDQRVTLFQFITEGVVRGNKFPTTMELAKTLIKDK